jgi:hypothetical protein
MFTSFKERDDDDFNTYIKQPFLTSAEQDKLIEQLRNCGFFEKMAYAADVADWVVLSALTAEEASKQGLAKQREQEILANQSGGNGAGLNPNPNSHPNP